MASNIQDEENAENLLISLTETWRNELSQLLNDSIDESHLLNYEEQHSNNGKSCHSWPGRRHKSVKNPKLLPPTSNLIFILPACHKNEGPCINHPTPETTVDKTLQPGVATGYVHNVSPLKMESTLIFNCKWSTRLSELSCFSPPKRKYFSEYSTSSTPVEIKKFKVDTNSNAEDLVMGNNVAVKYLIIEIT